MIPDYMHMYIAILNNLTESQNLSFMHASSSRKKIWSPLDCSISHYGNIIPSPLINFLQYILWDMAVP